MTAIDEVRSDAERLLDEYVKALHALLSQAGTGAGSDDLTERMIGSRAAVLAAMGADDRDQRGAAATLVAEELLERKHASGLGAPLLPFTVAVAIALALCLVALASSTISPCSPSEASRPPGPPTGGG